MIRSRSAALVVALAAGLAVGCATARPIAEIRDAPERCKERPVAVRGVVTDSIELSIAGIGYYQVEDATGRIWVQTLGPLPERGETVRVSGLCTPGIKIGSLELGLILRERG